MSKKLLILLFIGCIVAIVIHYNVPSRKNYTPQKRRRTNSKIVWVKKQHTQNKPKVKTKKSSKNAFYFNFPRLDNIKDQQSLNSYIDSFFSQDFQKRILVDVENLTKSLTNDINDALSIAKNINNLDESTLKSIKVDQEYHLAQNSKEQWLKISKQEGFWKNIKRKKTSVWVIQNKDKCIVEIKLAEDRQQPQNAKNYYSLYKILHKQFSQTDKQQIVQVESLLNEIASALVVFIKQYYKQKNPMIKQNLGYYYREILFLWEQTYTHYIDICLQNAEKKSANKELFISKMLEIKPSASDYENIAFLYYPQNPKKVMEWIEKVKEIDPAWAYFCLARFYASKDSKKALKNLELAFKNGFNDSERALQSDRDPWLSLQKNQKFFDLVGLYTGKY